LSEYNIASGSTIHMVLQLRGGANFWRHAFLVQRGVQGKTRGRKTAVTGLVS
jgi:hypothetical protein